MKVLLFYVRTEEERARFDAALAGMGVHVPVLVTDDPWIRTPAAQTESHLWEGAGNVGRILSLMRDRLQERLRAAFDRVFAMTPEELGQAAVVGAQRKA